MKRKREEECRELLKEHGWDMWQGDSMIGSWHRMGESSFTDGFVSSIKLTSAEEDFLIEICPFLFEEETRDNAMKRKDKKECRRLLTEKGYRAIGEEGFVTWNGPARTYSISDDLVSANKLQCADMDFLSHHFPYLLEEDQEQEELHHAAEREPLQGAKNDEDNYVKVDLSLVPWDILDEEQTVKNDGLRELFGEVHDSLQAGAVKNIPWLFAQTKARVNPVFTAVALGYGLAKYNDRDNWRKGFGGDPDRFLRAFLRHLHSYLCGEEYDGCVIPGYPKGNLHIGAVGFSMMVAENEERIKSGYCEEVVK